MDTKHRWRYDPNGWDHLHQFGGIQDGSVQIRWASQSQMGQRKVTPELRHFAFNRYGENDVAREATFLQGPTHQLHATPHRLRRFLNGQPIDGEKQWCGLRDIPLTDDETIAQWGAEGIIRIISPPRNPRPTTTNHIIWKRMYPPRLHRRWI